TRRLHAGRTGREQRPDAPAVRVADRPRLGLAQRALEARLLAEAEGGGAERPRVEQHVRRPEVAAERVRPRLGDLPALVPQRPEQLAGAVLLRQALDQLGLLERHGDLMRDGAEQVLRMLAPRLARTDDQRAEQ